ncbi:hypothetical protein [Bibersteinia trehalosi]|uniref:hypothetical protein n=1 Tax=Bibersteinia trehalosi TaxID=47735 RepID=UPI0040462B05
MKELKQCCLHHVSGGAIAVSSGCPECDDFFGIEEEKNTTTSSNRTGDAALIGGTTGGLIGARVGGAFGSPFGGIGIVAGTYIGTRLGEFIDESVKNNSLPPLGDPQILLDYIKNEQPW